MQNLDLGIYKVSLSSNAILGSVNSRDNSKCRWNLIIDLHFYFKMFHEYNSLEVWSKE